MLWWLPHFFFFFHWLNLKIRFFFFFYKKCDLHAYELVIMTKNKQWQICSSEKPLQSLAQYIKLLINIIIYNRHAKMWRCSVIYINRWLIISDAETILTHFERWSFLLQLDFYIIVCEAERKEFCIIWRCLHQQEILTIFAIYYTKECMQECWWKSVILLVGQYYINIRTRRLYTLC